MSVSTIQVERLTVVSKQPFETVISSLESAVGRPDLPTFLGGLKSAASLLEIEQLVARSVSELGLMIFLKFDTSSIFRLEPGFEQRKAQRFLIGNPLVMMDMAKHVPEAIGYAPITVLVDERQDGVYLGYDKMASLLAPYGSEAALSVAQKLDEKVEKLMRDAAEGIQR